jgi:hypothetical protein
MINDYTPAPLPCGMTILQLRDQPVAFEMQENFTNSLAFFDAAPYSYCRVNLALV